MIQYLSTAEMTARIHLGKEVEQWLSYTQEAGYAFIRWLVLDRNKNQVLVTYFESFDEGDNEFHDVHEFSVLDPENTPHGITHEFDSVEHAVAFAVEKYGAAADKFIVGGMIQEEYVKHLARRG